MTGAKPLEPSEVVEGGFGVDDERIEVEVRCEVAGEDDHHAWIGGRGSQVEGVDGPGEVGQVPGDVELRIAEAPEMAAAQPCDVGLEAAARDGLTKGMDERAGAAGAVGSMIEERDP